MYQTKEYLIRGIAPMLIHSGQTADPLNRFAKSMKEITSKRKKQDEDYRLLSDIEWLACFYEVGKDIHGRAVSLTFETDHYTKTSYRIHVEAANQRDDSQTIAGLTVEVILAMAEAVKAVPNT